MTVACLATALPGFLFVIYYTGVLGEAGWFYTYRSWPGTELTAAGMGLLAGWLQSYRNRFGLVRKYMSVVFIPFLLLVGVWIPYLKPLFMRPDWNAFQNLWSDGVCMQSSESSCGPASAATLLHLAGQTVTEKEIAMESYTSRRGTENWYLIRTMRRHGLRVNYRISEPGGTNLPYPAIVGVRLGGQYAPGHFITILGKAGDKYVTGDPITGRQEMDLTQLKNHYYFTGFAMVADLPNR